VGQYFVSRYLESADTRVHVCENLTSLHGEPIINFDQFGQALMQAARGETRDNPYVESIMAPLGYALRRPAVRELIEQVQRAKDTGDESFIEKAEFYSQLALATAQMWASKSEIERISQHAYHLYVISRVVNQKPDMAGDTDTIALCDAIQSSITNPPPTTSDVNAEKAALLRFLARAGLSPEQVEYDPNLPTTIGVEASTKQIALHIPWLEKVFRLNEPAPTPTAGSTPPPVREAMPLQPPTPNPIPSPNEAK
jgi:hypothetical protein